MTQICSLSLSLSLSLPLLLLSSGKLYFSPHMLCFSFPTPSFLLLESLSGLQQRALLVGCREKGCLNQRYSLRIRNGGHALLHGLMCPYEASLGHSIACPIPTSPDSLLLLRRVLSSMKRISTRTYKGANPIIDCRIKEEKKFVIITVVTDMILIAELIAANCLCNERAVAYP